MLFTITYTFDATTPKNFKQPVFKGPALQGTVRYNNGNTSQTVKYGTKTPGAVLGYASLSAEVPVLPYTWVEYRTKKLEVLGGSVTVTEPFVRLTDGKLAYVVLTGHEVDSYWAPGLIADWAPIWTSS
jgi:hypothetical protein